MSFVLCRPIATSRQALWGEGQPYQTQPIYSASAGEPPIFYNAHQLRPHSLCHAETLKHIVGDGPGIEQFCGEDSVELWFGPAVVLKVQAPQWARTGDVFVHRVDLFSLKTMLRRVGVEGRPRRLLLSCDPVPRDADGYHSAHYALVLEVEAAEWLAERSESILFGTSYRSLDFQPGSRERPVHRALLKRGVALELLDLEAVDEGHYLLASMPIPLVGASETLVSPVLFTLEEWKALSRA